jgi:hypothetical protein
MAVLRIECPFNEASFNHQAALIDVGSFSETPSDSSARTPSLGVVANGLRRQEAGNAAGWARDVEFNRSLCPCRD